MRENIVLYMGLGVFFMSHKSFLTAMLCITFFLFHHPYIIACKSNSFFGLNIDPKNPYGEAPITSLQELGIGSVRIEFKDSSEGDQIPTDGFNFFDSKIDSYHTSNIEILMIIDYSSLAGTPWGSSDPIAWTAFSEKYSARANVIATHYKGKISAYQIWNEPDLVGDESYKPYIPSQSYGKILKKAYETIKAADPNAKVITGSFASGNMSYISQMKSAAGGTIYADAVAIHPYGQRAPDNMPQPQWGFGNLSEFITIVKGYSSGKPLWITELGTVDQNYQSDYVKAVYRMTFNQFRTAIDRVFWFCWSDSMVPPFGLVDTNQQPKNTYHSYKSIFQELLPSISQDQTDCEPSSQNDTPDTSQENNNTSDNVTPGHQGVGELEQDEDENQQTAGNENVHSPVQSDSNISTNDIHNTNDQNSLSEYIPSLKRNGSKSKIDDTHSERSEGCECQPFAKTQSFTLFQSLMCMLCILLKFLLSSKTSPKKTSPKKTPLEKNSIIS